MMGEMEHLKDSTPFHSQECFGFSPMDLTEQDTGILPLKTLPSVLFEEKMTRGGGTEGWKEQGEGDGSAGSASSSRVRHPGEQHRGAREPSQGVPELSWLPRWWLKSWTLRLRARRSSRDDPSAS